MKINDEHIFRNLHYKKQTIIYCIIKVIAHVLKSTL